MANESIEQQRQRVFSQCRRLLHKINDTGMGQTVLAASPQRYIDAACQCCDEHFRMEELTQIDSGHLLCPICLNALKDY